MEPYEYDLLRNGRLFRIMELFPGLQNSRLKCSLHLASLDIPLCSHTFEAVSYTWGTDERVRLVICDEQQIKVTANCEAVLRQLRLSDRARFLWIDTICIDQSSISERNAQVKLMADVYSKASTVICWLGESSVESDCGFDVLDYTLSTKSQYTSRFLVEESRLRKCVVPITSRWLPQKMCSRY